MKIPKGQSESVYRRKTDNTIVKRKSTKGQITIYKTYTYKLKFNRLFSDAHSPLFLYLISRCGEHATFLDDNQKYNDDKRVEQINRWDSTKQNDFIQNIDEI